MVKFVTLMIWSFIELKQYYVMTENPHENASLSELLVEKRSGNSEKFDEEKLVRGINRAGTPFLLPKIFQNQSLVS